MTTVADILASSHPLSLAADYDGCCPCCEIEGDGFTVLVHCWRAKPGGCDCEYSGIHVSGLPADVAQRVAKHVRDHNGWTGHTEYTIVVEEK